MAMGAGAFNRRIEFQHYVTTRDSEGVYTKSWQTLRKLWAKVYPVSGKEYFQAATTQNENTVRVVIRYRKDITSAMRFLYEGRSYEIVDIINDNDARITLTIVGKVVT
jgi:SPP1 family predicted phage head-tail adaptor